MAYEVDDLAEKPSKAWFYFVIAFDDLFPFVLFYPFLLLLLLPLLCTEYYKSSIQTSSDLFVKKKEVEKNYGSLTSRVMGGYAAPWPLFYIEGIRAFL